MFKHMHRHILVKDMDQYCWIMCVVMEMRLLFLTANIPTKLGVITALMQELTAWVSHFSEHDNLYGASMLEVNIEFIYCPHSCVYIYCRTPYGRHLISLYIV